VQRVGIGGRHADDGADLADRAGERVEFERPPGFGVLEHRGADVAELARDRVPVVGGLLDRAADPRADLARFEHGRRAERDHEVVGQDLAHGRPGHGADRVHRQVAPQLVPDVRANARRDRDVEAGAAQRRRERVEPRRSGARRLADDDAVPAVQPYHAGLRRAGAQVHGAADHAADGKRRGDPAAGVHAVEVAPGDRAAEAVEEPPRHAVERRQHGGVRTEQRADARDRTGQRLGLDRQHHEVLRAEFGGVVRRGQLRGHGAVGGLDGQPPGPDGGERGAARVHANVGAARVGQPGRDDAADRAGAHDTDAHATRP